MKHLLVVDVELTKENKHICKDDNNRCPLWNEEISFCMYNFNNNTKGCPLKPMPKRMLTLAKMSNGEILNNNEIQYMKGRNDCIDDILGEEE